MHFEWLFTYGNLQDKEIQLAIFGRIILGKKDELESYKVGLVSIENTIYPIINFTNSKLDRVEGTLYKISLNEIEKADVYEASFYARKKVRLVSNKEAWAYLA